MAGYGSSFRGYLTWARIRACLVDSGSDAYVSRKSLPTYLEKYGIFSEPKYRPGSLPRPLDGLSRYLSRFGHFPDVEVDVPLCKGHYCKRTKNVDSMFNNRVSLLGASSSQLKARQRRDGHYPKGRLEATQPRQGS